MDPAAALPGDHYDLHPCCAIGGVELGAVEVGTGELVQRMRGPWSARAGAARAVAMRAGRGGPCS
jgi:hypothetical protein